ncbi:MBL fold metallo-hydrolase [Rhodanobacter ginsengisoli]|uniref:MBL fold metallo-hydrolase n=1 Tax=Rhodanobacter ginsengisoli TaxID=418646 RepID=A0ABW0QS39_9GAMM
MRLPLLPTLLGFFALAVLTGSAAPAHAPDSRREVPVARDMVLIPGTFVPGRQPDGNSIVLRGTEGLIVFDSGRHPAHTRRILDHAHASGLPIVAVVNSHWHLDHVSGNPMLRAAYPQLQVYASHAIEGALTGFLADSRKQAAALIAQHKIPAAQLADVEGDMATIDRGRELLPDHFVEHDGDRMLAGRPVHLGLARDAVTAGDVWLYDPQTRVLLAGDLVTLPAPLLDTACPPRWRAQLATLDALPFVTLVPGHGAAMDHAGFHRYRRAFDALLDCAASHAGDAVCTDRWLHDVEGLVPADRFKLARGLLGYYLDQVLHAPSERRNRYCPA